MTEKHIILSDIDPLMLYGANNGNLQIIKSLYPKLRIVARDNIIKIIGDEEEMAKLESQIDKMCSHISKYNNIAEEDILDIIKGRTTRKDEIKGVLAYNISGNPIKAKSKNQQQLIDSFNKNDMIFAIGPAGSGKTYLSIALAVWLKESCLLMNHRVVEDRDRFYLSCLLVRNLAFLLLQRQVY